MAKTAQARKRSMAGFIGATDGLPLAPANTTPPAITGTAQVGETLTASGGEWAGRNTPWLRYQWNVGGEPVEGATGATYEPVEGDVGDVVTVTVIARNWKGVASETSAATDAVAGAE